MTVVIVELMYPSAHRDSFIIELFLPLCILNVTEPPAIEAIPQRSQQAHQRLFKTSSLSANGLYDLEKYVTIVHYASEQGGVRPEGG